VITFVIKQLFVQHFTTLVLGVVARGAGYPRFLKKMNKNGHNLSINKVHDWKMSKKAKAKLYKSFISLQKYILIVVHW